MTSVSKEYEIKIKTGTGAMTIAKKVIFIGLYFENCYTVGRINFC